MANAPISPLGVYLEHLENGELAYQFSPDANAAVFYPRVICPVHRQRQSGMAGQQGARHGACHHGGASRRRASRTTLRWSMWTRASA